MKPKPVKQEIIFTRDFILSEIEKEKTAIRNCHHKWNNYLEALEYILEIQSDLQAWNAEISSCNKGG